MPCVAGAVLREIWAAGEVALGGWNVIGDPFAAELVCRSGVDWLEPTAVVGRLEVEPGAGR
jgi:hypothetical protein